jgi:hypothetical protein
MPLAERLSSPPARRSRPCAVGRLLADLPESDRAALLRVLGDDGWTTSDILAELRAEGHQVSHTTLLRHRKDECACR